MTATDTPGDMARKLLDGLTPDDLTDPAVSVLAAVAHAVLEVADAAWLITTLLRPGNESDDDASEARLDAAAERLRLYFRDRDWAVQLPDDDGPQPDPFVVMAQLALGWTS